MAIVGSEMMESLVDVVLVDSGETTGFRRQYSKKVVLSPCFIGQQLTFQTDRLEKPLDTRVDCAGVILILDSIRVKVARRQSG